MKELPWCSSYFFLQIENMNLWCFSFLVSHLGLTLELSRLAIIFYLILIHRCLSCFEVIFIIALYTYDLLHALSNILENSAHLYQFVWPPLNSFSQHFIDPTAPRFMAIIFPIFIWPRSGASVFQPQTAITDTGEQGVSGTCNELQKVPQAEGREEITALQRRLSHNQ